MGATCGDIDNDGNIYLYCGNMYSKAGSRVIAVIPPKEGFGSTGNSSIGVTGTDTLVFVVDMIQAFSNTAGATGQQVTTGGGALPTVTATSGKAPAVTLGIGLLHAASAAGGTAQHRVGQGAGMPLDGACCWAADTVVMAPVEEVSAV